MFGILTGEALSNVIGSDTQNFNPTTGQPDYVTVQSTRPLSPGRFNFGLFVNQATNSLLYKSDGVQSHTKFNDSLVGMDLGIGIGVLPNLELGLALPFVAHQSIDDESAHGEFEERGNTEVRVGAKYRFLQKGNFGLAGLASANINRIRENPHTGSGAGPTYNLELAADWALGKWDLAVNAGYRIRTPGEPVDGALVEPLGNQILGSLGARYRLTKASHVVGELYAAQAAVKTDSNRAGTSAEVLGGYRHELTPGTIIQAGLGTEAIEGIATPDWRFYLGINQMIEPAGAKGRTVAKKKKRRKAQKASLASMEPMPEDNRYFASVAEEETNNATGPLPMGGAAETFVLRDVNFEFDSDYRILPGGIAELEKIANHARAKGYQTIVVEGHTDYYGSDEYNDDLSLRRAKTVRRHFIRYLGFTEDQVIAVGYGERQPKTTDMSDAGRQINRRVEVKLYE